MQPNRLTGGAICTHPPVSCSLRPQAPSGPGAMQGWYRLLAADGDLGETGRDLGMVELHHGRGRN